MSFPTVDEQLAIIKRGAVEIVPESELIEKLKKSGRKTSRCVSSLAVILRGQTFILAIR